MITKITLNNLASFRNNTILETDKRINLIYGLNGTGKSTLSDYLFYYNDKQERHHKCKIDGLVDNNKILVYNQSFINDIFYNADTIGGIFSLSEENTNALGKIEKAKNEIAKLELEKKEIEKDILTEKSIIQQKENKAKETIWEIKINYSGNGRVLDYCLEGYRNNSNKLFDFINTLDKPKFKPESSTKDLELKLESISNTNSHKYSMLQQINFESQYIENELIFKKQIIGNENSTFSELINNWDNSDWVKDGLQYISKEHKGENDNCPFCQEKTISIILKEKIQSYFDTTFQSDLDTLKSLLDNYKLERLNIPNKSVFEENPKYELYKNEFEMKYGSFFNVIETNIRLIENKVKTPSVSITLSSSNTLLVELNDIIQNINSQIVEHNRNIDQKDVIMDNIKTTFWNIMRWDYDQTISSFKSDLAISNHKFDILEAKLKENSNKIIEQNEIVVVQQKLTINIEDAINNINIGLVNLGIADFKIIPHSENLYKIVRDANQEKVFHSLSEGEKMIISFLYFIELCRGKTNTTETNKKKIILIDDPISSLSHIYVYNIGRLIHNEIFNNTNYDQIFLLTHSLYFFYEMTDLKHERRNKNQKLFRIIKNTNGSEIIEMQYEELQNDYHSYWFIVKDDKNHPALIANCMRNIIEYFFNFVEKQNLYNVFQKPAMKEIRFQAFKRYMERESHSVGQNIFDIKEFNYSDFKEAFALVFKENGYEDHYNKMIK